MVVVVVLVVLGASSKSPRGTEPPQVISPWLGGASLGVEEVTCSLADRELPGGKWNPVPEKPPSSADLSHHQWRTYILGPVYPGHREGNPFGILQAPHPSFFTRDEILRIHKRVEDGGQQGAGVSPGCNTTPVHSDFLTAARRNTFCVELRRSGVGAHWNLMSSPWNIMIKHRLVQRRGRRSQMMSSFTDPVVSMDLLRAVLQPTINEEIQAVFNKYMKFFQKAAGNVRENVGEDVDTEQLIQDTCRSCLEQAKLLFCDGKKSVARLPHDMPAMKVETGLPPAKAGAQGIARVTCRGARGQKPPADDELSQQGSPMPKKRKGRPPGQSQVNERGTTGTSMWKTKSCEPLQRDGPKWNPSRITEGTAFVLGSRANKALGMGGTRGRLYIKHPHLFKYAADPQDKHWLAEQQHMRATGGKMAYLLLEEDIQDLVASDEYRGSLDLKLEELKPFVPPPWMTVKMRKYMEQLRCEGEQPPTPAEGGLPDT
ncbi:PREDICTED: deoxynucleotidyltransferase terminal-interacting protein 1 [Gekko japonicus]|uniref:Deoxynucleotidyltransferase terminal-interacting protein 1 n=1 Tax=Gekko japonicus TaxID=146911 RepID=A0ABM1K269_GEKJA|nr:PREDICTED: deoxynucleotidyltransferase terminal-interacting protein 1 [Gekko japonicus]